MNKSLIVAKAKEKQEKKKFEEAVDRETQKLDAEENKANYVNDEDLKVSKDGHLSDEEVEKALKKLPKKMSHSSSIGKWKHPTYEDVEHNLDRITKMADNYKQKHEPSVESKPSGFDRK